MGHAGHGFHNNLHYHRPKPYGPVVSAVRGVLAVGALAVNPIGWLIVYSQWQAHRERKKADEDKATTEHQS